MLKDKKNINPANGIFVDPAKLAETIQQLQNNKKIKKEDKNASVSSTGQKTIRKT